MIRLALVGPGRWGRILVEAVQNVSDKVVFTHAVARSPAKAADWCAAKGITLSPDLPTALADPAIDGIVLTTPHSQHASQIVQVARAGKDLFCEKPIALTHGDAQTALRAVDAAGIVFATGYNRRFLPAIERMKKMISAGELGRILHAEGNMSSHVGFGEVYTQDMWRVAPGESPAGGLAAAGIHVIDVMVHLLGPVATVFAQSDRLVHEIDHDDTTNLLLRFDSRATGVVTTLTATAGNFRIQVFGERGWLALQDERTLIWASVRGDRDQWIYPSVSTEQIQLETFAHAIRTRVPYPIPPEEVLNGIATFEAVSRSLAMDRRVLVQLCTTAL